MNVEFSRVMNELTGESRRALALARQTAIGYGQNFISTEHLLLGLVGISDAEIVQLCAHLRIDPDRVAAEVEDTIRPGYGEATGNPPMTPQTKRVLERSRREAPGSGQSAIRPIHILLGLVLEGEPAIAKDLFSMGMDLDALRKQAGNPS